MRRLRTALGAALAAALAAPAPAAIPEVTVEEVVKSGAGGSFTIAAVARIRGRTTFLKSNRGSARGTRYANFESDVVAGELFARLGVHAPRATIVRLAPESPLRDDLGEVVLAMEFVDDRFAGGKVRPGGWPRQGEVLREEFADLFVVDALLANADRRDANLFSVRLPGDGPTRPIPIDNNGGLGTPTCWTGITSLSGFVRSYDGVLAGDEVLAELGTLRSIVRDARSHDILLGFEENHAVVRARVERAVELLDDAFLEGVVSALPDEFLPDGVALDPADPGVAWIRERLPAEAQELLLTAGERLEGDGLRRHRRREVYEILRWRRDHLAAALEAYLEYRRTDPEELDRWETARLWYGLD